MPRRHGVRRLQVDDHGHNRQGRLFNVIGYALLTLIGGLAFLSAAKEILPALFARERPEFSTRVKAAAVIIVVCVLAAFLPVLINSITEFAGQGVDLGTVAKS